MQRSLALMSLLSGVLLLSIFTEPANLLAQEPAAEEAAIEMEAEETAASEAESAEAEEDPYASVSEGVQTRYALDNLILFLCAVLVLFMQPGFAMVEVGFNSSKNAANILFKNVMDLCIGVLLYWTIGYALMYPGEEAIARMSPYFAYSGSVGASSEMDAANVGPGTLFGQADFLFQAAFAATAATIVSGAVAGRMKFVSYLIYSAVITAFIYPVSGMWKWGGGWLHMMEFHDFAGSIVVHAVGGFAGLAGAIALGPRIGRYTADGRSVAMPGHNLTFAALGVFILWVGWYGFNPGSNLVFSDAASVNTTMLIATNTTLAAAAGGFFAMVLGWVMFGKPDLSMALNGILAGLVGITANCDAVTNVESILIGGIAGLLVVLGIVALDKLRIDDPVGAFPVHGLCGVWGGLATGIFGEGKNLAVQAIGSAVIPAWAFVTMLVLFLTLKAAGLLRVSPEEEAAGLDIGEHGMHAYTA